MYFKKFYALLLVLNFLFVFSEAAREERSVREELENIDIEISQAEQEMRRLSARVRLLCVGVRLLKFLVFIEYFSEYNEWCR